MLHHLTATKHLNYNPDTGIITWNRLLIHNQVRVGDEAGSFDKRDGYRRVRFMGDTYLTHRLGWFLHKGHWPNGMLDHKDRIRDHNWISNLREATRMCNARNCGNFSHNTSGVKGVNWHKRDKIWAANIVYRKKSYFLGYYTDFDDAVCARLSAEQCLEWSGCDSNSPSYQYVKENIQNVME